MKKLSIEQLNEMRKEKERESYNISIDFANVWYLSSSSYICDSISEHADSQVDIYYSDRAKWFAENVDHNERWDDIADKVNELLEEESEG